MPTNRIFPADLRVVNASRISSSGVVRSSQWVRYRSIQSDRSRRRLFSHSRSISDARRPLVSPDRDADLGTDEHAVSTLTLDHPIPDYPLAFSALESGDPAGVHIRSVQERATCIRELIKKFECTAEPGCRNSRFRDIPR